MRCDPALSADLRLALDVVRRPKDEIEIERMRVAERATSAAFAAAVPLLVQGSTERSVQVELETAALRAGADAMAYDTIVGAGTNSAVLHFMPTDRRLVDGDLVLIDAGADYRQYASDITRTYPVGGRLSPEQAELHAVVHAAERAAMERCVPGTEWVDVHMTAAQVIAEGLVAFGVLRGDPGALVESGAVWLFFPHGIGHLVGLGVRDAAGPLRARRDKPSGIANLRIDLPLEAGLRRHRRAGDLLRSGHSAGPGAARPPPRRGGLGPRRPPAGLRRHPHRGQPPDHRRRPRGPHGGRAGPGLIGAFRREHSAHPCRVAALLDRGGHPVDTRGRDGRRGPAAFGLRPHQRPGAVAAGHALQAARARTDDRGYRRRPGRHTTAGGGASGHRRAGAGRHRRDPPLRAAQLGDPGGHASARQGPGARPRAGDWGGPGGGRRGRIHGPEGLLSLRAGPHGRFLGALNATHQRALGLVYGAALGGWSYLVSWGVLAAFGVDGAQEGGAAIGAVAGLGVMWDVERLGRSVIDSEAGSFTIDRNLSAE